MFPLSFDELKNLQKDDLKSLVKLDDNGCFAAVNESFEDYKSRLLREFDELKKFYQEIEASESVKIFDDIKVSKSDLVSKDIIKESNKKTRNLYDFHIDYLPAFFLNQDIGLLWGGCSIYDESTSQRIILIRKNFKKARRWFIYDRQELLAHELSHSARQVLNDRKVEEFFAYQTSQSAFRRYTGNCFISDVDAILFVLPPLLLLAAQIVNTYFFEKFSVTPFWWLTALMFCFFGVRNHLSRRLVFKAKNKLNKFKINKADALIFRCNSAEIKEIGKLNSRESFFEWIQNKAETQIRFQVIRHKWKFNE